MDQLIDDSVEHSELLHLIIDMVFGPNSEVPRTLGSALLAISEFRSQLSETNNEQ